MRIFLALTLAMFSLGCSTYSKTQCDDFNWQDIGYNSALRGELNNEMPIHYGRECTEEHQVRVNQDQFLAGYNKGLAVVCSAEGGRSLGKMGKAYKGICPKEEEEAFMKSYESGRVDFLANRVEELELKVRRLDSDNSDKEDKIRDLESELTSLRHKHCP